MQRNANATLVGVFVAGGVALFIVAMVLLGAGSFSGAKPKAIAYFEDSVSGLDIGAPVKFRGVSVGKVAQVLLRTPGQPGSDYAVPVVMEFNPNLLIRRGLESTLVDDSGLSLSIDKGLRAKLQQQSVITGVLYVELDYFPDTPVKLHDNNGELPEIPTLPSNLGALTKAVSQTLDQLSKVDFLSITNKIDSILGRLDDGVSRIEFKRINGNLVAASENIAKVTGDPALAQAIKDFSSAMKGVESLSLRLDSKVDPLSADIRSLAEAGRSALRQFDDACANLRNLTRPGSPARRDLEQALSEISEAAQAIRSLADFIERNPETVLTGRRGRDTVERKVEVDGKEAPVSR